jgi:hypothetical protein
VPGDFLSLIFTYHDPGIVIPQGYFSPVYSHACAGMNRFMQGGKYQLPLPEDVNKVISQSSD